MRRIVGLLACVVLTIGCKSKSQKEQQLKKEVETNPAVYEIEKIPETERAAYHQRLSHFFDSSLLRSGFNGAILVAKGGNILYESYNGYKNPATKTDTIDKNTAFHLASTSKPFTGIAVLKLIQDQQLGLLDTITKFFPDLPYPGITVKDLLSHRSGLPNYLSVMEDKTKWDPKKMVSNQDVLNFMTEFTPPVMFRPNTRFAYCNTNFVMLALIVEKITGQQFPVYLKKTIFDPLQMTNTFVYTPADSGNVIMSYKPSAAVWDNDIFENTYGDKNVYSTPGDLFKWDRALYNNSFIRQSLLDSAFHPLSQEKPSVHNYGLGWRLLNLPNGKNVTYHNGKWHGFTPAFTRLTDEHAVIIILTNKLTNMGYNAARLSYDIFGPYMQQNDSAAGDEGQQEITAPPGPVKAARNTGKKAVSNRVEKNKGTVAKVPEKNAKTAGKNRGRKAAAKPAPVVKQSAARNSSRQKTATAGKSNSKTAPKKK